MPPKVSIIITAYLEKTKPYLDILIESIRNLKYDGAYDVTIISPTWYKPRYIGVNTISPIEGEYHNPQALNAAIKATTGEYIFMLNDDVLLTRDCLQILMSYKDAPMVAVTMPISNDSQGRYAANVIIRPGPYKIDEILPFYKEMIDAKSPYPKAMIFCETLCLYAALIPRRVFEDVGYFDENLKTGFDDTDFCLRLRDKYICSIALDAIAYHAGGVSADHTLTPQVRSENEAYFTDKWNR